LAFQPLAFAHESHPAAPPAAQTAEEAAFLKENDVAMTKMMNDMSAKPSGDIDRDFVATMKPHHQGAIARRSGATIVEASEVTKGHDICSAEPRRWPCSYSEQGGRAASPAPPVSLPSDAGFLCDSCPKLDVCSDAFGELLGRAPLRFTADVGDLLENPGRRQDSRSTWRELLCCSHRTQEVAHFNLQPVALGGQRLRG
jgi:hypothetical protein